MKTTEIALQTKTITNAGTNNITRGTKGLKYLFFLFLVSVISFLPACAVAVRTPEPNIVVETHHHRVFRGKHYRQTHMEYRNNDRHHR
jgi:hypothetical protein